MINIITGEKIQKICEHYLGTFEYLNFNPYSDRSKFLIIDYINEVFDNNMNIYCPTHITRDLELLIEKLKFMKNKFNLILHNSDDNFTEQHLKLFEIDNLMNIFTQNMNVIHPNVFPLPIGLQNQMWVYNQENIINDIIVKNNCKTRFIYCNFSTSTTTNRQKCYEACIKNNISFSPRSSFNNYLKELNDYIFCICPEGNGLDTHRFWECLYLKVIPVAIRNPFTEYYSKYFPIFLLDNWDDFDVNDVKIDDMNWENYSMLDIDNLFKFIKSPSL
jgi:hypothetical protein